MELVRQILVAFVMFTFITYSSACMGYKVEIIKLETCDGSIGKIEPGASVTLTNDCKLVIKGCGETSGFSTAKLTYTVNKDGNRIMSGTMDACDKIAKDKSGVADALAQYELPNKCPVEQMKKCVDGSQPIDISKQKSYLSLAKGTIQVKIDGEHDTGKSCFDLEVKISK